MLGGSWWAPERQVLLGEGFLVARGSSSWKGSFAMVAGFCGLLECRVCAFGWHAGGGLGGLQNSRYCWVKGFWLPGDHLHGRLSFDMVAGFCGLLECRVCLGG